MHEPIMYGADQMCPKCSMFNRSGLILPDECHWCHGTGKVDLKFDIDNKKIHLTKSK